MSGFVSQSLMTWKRTLPLDVAEAMVYRLSTSERLEDLAEGFQECVLALEGSKFAFAQFRAWDCTPCFSVVHTYDKVWSERYLSRNYHLCDPVFLSMKTLYRPLIWDFSKKRNFSHDQEVFLSEASAFGLSSGITFPVVDTSGSRSFMTVVGAQKRAVHPQRASLLSFMSRVFHERKIFLEKRQVLKKLSHREQEVLSLKAQGHVTKVVAGMLGISESTAVEYLHNAKLKLGCMSLDQALFRYGQLLG